MSKKVVLFLLCFSWVVVYTFPDVRIITNPGTEIPPLKKKDIKDIFTGKRTRWNGSGKITIAILEDSETHSEFLREFVKKTPSQFRNYWRRKVFTGEGTFPRTFGSEAELMDFVAATKGAVGYIGSPPKKNVKVIEINSGKGGGH